MIANLIRALKKRKQWNKDHDLAWNGYLVLESDDLSPLQKKCLEAAEEHNLIKNHKIVREEHIEENIIILNSVNSEASFKVYNGDAELFGVEEFLHVEECGCLTPDEFISQIMDKLKEYTCQQ